MSDLFQLSNTELINLVQESEDEIESLKTQLAELRDDYGNLESDFESLEYNSASWDEVESNVYFDVAKIAASFRSGDYTQTASLFHYYLPLEYRYAS